MTSLLTPAEQKLAARISASESEQAIEPRQHLSFSQLNTFQDCGEKFRLRYVVGAPAEVSGAMLGGIAIHETIEEAEHQGWWVADLEPDPFLHAESEGIVYFQEHLDALIRERTDGHPERVRWGGKGHGEEREWWRKNGEFMLRRYAATRQAWHEIGWQTVEGGTEMRVSARLEGVKLPVVGYVDKFLMREVDLATGEIAPEPAIVDWKTGKVGSANPMQFATYAVLLEEGPHITTTLGLAVYLRAPEAERRVQAVHFAPIVPRMKAVYAALVDGVGSARFTPNPHAWCSSCEVRESCWYFNGTQPPGGDDRDGREAARAGAPLPAP